MMRAHRIEPVENSHTHHGRQAHDRSNPAWMLVAERETDNPLMVPGRRVYLEANLLGAYAKKQRGEALRNDDWGMASIVADCYPGCTFEHIKTHERVTVE